MEESVDKMELTLSKYTLVFLEYIADTFYMEDMFKEVFVKSTNFIMNFFIFMAVLISIFYLYVITVFFVDYKIRSASFIKKISS